MRVSLDLPTRSAVLVLISFARLLITVLERHLLFPSVYVCECVSFSGLSQIEDHLVKALVSELANQGIVYHESFHADDKLLLGLNCSTHDVRMALKATSFDIV